MNLGQRARTVAKLLSLVAAVAAVAGVTGCSADAAEAPADATAAQSAVASRTVRASEAPELSQIDVLVGVHDVRLPRGAARVYELIGGDGLNAARIGVAVDAPSGATHVWSLGAMLSAVESVEPLGDRGLVVHATRDTFAADGETQAKESVKLEITWTLDDAKVGSVLSVVSGGAVTREQEERSPQATLLGNVTGVTSAQVDELSVSAITVRTEGGGSDLLVSIGSFYGGSKHFALGVPAHHVTALGAAGPGRVRIASQADILGETEAASAQVHEIAFTRSGDDVGDAIQLTKTR